MRIQTLIFTALLFILPTIAVGAATNCPIQDDFTTTDENGNPIDDDTNRFKQACTDTPGCEYSAILKKCPKCPVAKYKKTSANLCTNCTNKPNAAQYLTTHTGMQADICPWKLKCTTGQTANNDNQSCKACQSHQYQNQEFYIVYNKDGNQDKEPDTEYTYHKIGQNDNVGDQLSSAPECENKKINIQLNKPCNTEGCTLSGASLSNEQTLEYECQSNNNNLTLTLANGYYTLVGYSTATKPNVDADYNYTSTSDPDCYTLNDICTNKTNGTTIYAIWKPAEYQINYYFGDTPLQTVKADFSTRQSITDIKGKISETGNQWPESADIIFDIYEVYDNGQKTISSQQKIGAPIPHPSKAGNNISIKILCPAGYYCENDNNAQYAVDKYKPCPDGKTSALGSTTVDNCTYENYTTFCDLNGCMTFK